MQDVDQPRLDKLRLGHRRGNAQDRLVGEEDPAFGHGVDIPRKAEIRQVAEEIVTEPARSGQPADLFLREAQVFEKGQGLIEPGRDQEAAARRELAHEELEDGRAHLPMLQVGLEHVELVEIG